VTHTNLLPLTATASATLSGQGRITTASQKKLVSNLAGDVMLEVKPKLKKEPQNNVNLKISGMQCDTSEKWYLTEKQCRGNFFHFSG
jgi:hypothetical protein